MSTNKNRLKIPYFPTFEQFYTKITRKVYKLKI